MAYRCLIGFIFVCLPLFSSAQIGDSFAQSGPEIRVSSSFPEPYTALTAELDDYSIDSTGLTITWKINGQEVSGSRNTRRISFTTGALGTRSRVEVVLSAPGRQTVTASTIITPVYLDIILEPQTYAPSFFGGRTLPSPGSSVLATAVINGNAIPPSSLIYTWKVDRTVIEGGALPGRNKILLTTPTYGSPTLYLEVKNTQGETVATKNIALPSVDPEVRFYEVNSLYGIANRPIVPAGVTLIGNGMTVRAVPYHLDIRTYNNPDIVEWKINNVRSSVVNANPYEATFARQMGVGVAQVNFQVRNLTQLLQGSQAGFQINY